MVFTAMKKNDKLLCGSQDKFSSGSNKESPTNWGRKCHGTGKEGGGSCLIEYCAHCDAHRGVLALFARPFYALGAFSERQCKYHKAPKAGIYWGVCLVRLCEQPTTAVSLLVRWKGLSVNLCFILEYYRYQSKPPQNYHWICQQQKSLLQWPPITDNTWILIWKKQ